MNTCVALCVNRSIRCVLNKVRLTVSRQVCRRVQGLEVPSSASVGRTRPATRHLAGEPTYLSTTYSLQHSSLVIGIIGFICRTRQIEGLLKYNPFFHRWFNCTNQLSSLDLILACLLSLFLMHPGFNFGGLGVWKTPRRV